MRAYVTLRAPDGARHDLVHGDLVGRLSTAALPLDDARVSEAHAMVSLRERALHLIALRGGMAVDGRPVNEVCLRPGLDIVLARGLALRVHAVHLPADILGLAAPRLVPQVLPPVASLVVDPRVRLVAGYLEDAAAVVWCTGASWRLRTGTLPPRDLKPGDTFTVGDQTIRAVAIPLGAAGQTPTRAGGGVQAPLRIEANFDTVHLHRDGAVAAVLGGNHARIVSELVALGGPIHWRGMAALLWPQDPEPDAVRSRFDVTLCRLRSKLKAAQIRTDLVHTDGAGQVGLLLYPHDVVDDRT